MVFLYNARKESFAKNAIVESMIICIDKFFTMCYNKDAMHLFNFRRKE